MLEKIKEKIDVNIEMEDCAV